MVGKWVDKRASELWKNVNSARYFVRQETFVRALIGRTIARDRNLTKPRLKNNSSVTNIVFGTVLERERTWTETQFAFIRLIVFLFTW